VCVFRCFIQIYIYIYIYALYTLYTVDDVDDLYDLRIHIFFLLLLFDECNIKPLEESTRQNAPGDVPIGGGGGGGDGGGGGGGGGSGVL